MSFLHLAAIRISFIVGRCYVVAGGPAGKELALMRKILVAVIAVISVLSLSACADDWIGKGKGKAPPPEPVAEPAPVYK